MFSYDNLLVIGDFNSDMSEMTMFEFCETCNLQNAIKIPHVTKIFPNKPVLI